MLREVPVRRAGLFDVRTDLDAPQAQLAHAPLELADRQVRVLHRHGPQPDESARVLLVDTRDVVVEETGQVQRVLGLGPVREHHRHGRQDLDLHARSVHVAQTGRRVVAARLDRAEVLVLDKQLGPARAPALARDRIKAHEPPVAILLGQVGPAGREDVGVDVDFIHGWASPQRTAESRGGGFGEGSSGDAIGHAQDIEVEDEANGAGRETEIG